MSRYDAQIDKLAYRPPSDVERVAIEDARARVMDLMRFMADAAPESREASLALMKLDEALFWFNSAVMRN